MNSGSGIYMAFGANKAWRGHSPTENIVSAIKTLNDKAIKVRAVSRPWLTPAWPDPSDPPYINACARIETDLPPADLLAALHEIEAGFGRTRDVANAPRALDLDLIDYHGRIETGGEGGLILPHPRATARAFVLLPLYDIAPRWRDPLSNTPIEALIAALAPADRQAARPVGPSLCAAAVGLKRDAR